MTREKLPWELILEAGRGERLVAESRFGSRAARAAPLPPELHPQVAQALRAAGVEELYAHQAEAFEAVRQGHVIVTTGTASG